MKSADKSIYGHLTYIDNADRDAFTMMLIKKERILVDAEKGVVQIFKKNKIGDSPYLKSRIDVAGYYKYKISHKGRSPRNDIFEHHIVWVSVNGMIPDFMMIDHINGKKTDNRICNLRLVTAQGNANNKKKYNHSLSCDNLKCFNLFIPVVKSQRFCSTSCREAYHTEDRISGQKARSSKGMHFAKLSGSPRLQRFLNFLLDMKIHTTWEIQTGARICNVGTTASELRRNPELHEKGYDLPPAKFKHQMEDGSKIFEYQLIKHNV